MRPLNSFRTNFATLIRTSSKGRKKIDPSLLAVAEAFRVGLVRSGGRLDPADVAAGAFEFPPFKGNPRLQRLLIRALAAIRTDYVVRKRLEKELRRSLEEG